MPDPIVNDGACRFPREALSLEWLETNGLGGYSSSTAANCHTRKYHGLFTVNLDKPAGRQVILSKLEDSLSLKGEEYFFSSHQYPGLFFQGSNDCLTACTTDPAPQFTYQLETAVLRKTIMYLHDRNCLLIRYDLANAPSAASLRIKPFFAYRGFHGLQKENPSFDTRSQGLHKGFTLHPYRSMPPVFMQTNIRSRFLPAPLWYYNFEYLEEKRRGYDWQEDLFQPGILEIPLKNDFPVIISVSLQINTRQLGLLWKAEERRRQKKRAEEGTRLEGHLEEDRENLLQLSRAARQFLIRTPGGRPAVIAGYHWFDDWGRDTLISLPGLAFCTGNHQMGIDVLESLGKYERQGLLPNFFTNDRDGAYNSVDSSLWFFWAVQQMHKLTGKVENIKESLWPVMKKIIATFLTGTVYNIGVTDQGLLHAGDEDTNLTWMDARVDGRPATPRWGLAVEINALWYNALSYAAELATLFGERAPFPDDLPRRLGRAFQETFWIEDGAYLGDVFRQGALDRAIRPNQIFAVSLPFSPLRPDQAAGVVRTVQDHLLTPCGLRTLAPGHEQYQGRYEGDQARRDGAYHQGTVWPWLLAPFGEAYLKTAPDKEEARKFLLSHLRSFLGSHLKEAGLGCVSEIFDGDPPHHPRGCISQAWSVAELIRLYCLLT